MDYPTDFNKKRPGPWDKQSSNILLSWILYHLGDLACKLHLWNLYQWCMKKSLEFDDPKGRIWQTLKLKEEEVK